MRCFYTYILSSKSRVLYIGITNNLERRLWEHRNQLSNFTARYKVTRLVYYEVFEDPLSAIYREKRLKKLYRRQKIELIERENPAWDDLAADWF
jgi:putative endonuclease